MATSSPSGVNTSTEDTLCVCCLSDGKLLSGHQSVFKIWSPISKGHPCLLQTVEVPGEISNICQSPRDQYHIAVAVSSSVLVFDLRNSSVPFQVHSYNQEEINEVCFHSTCPYICACDDFGEIRIIDTAASKLFKTLTGHHSSLCTCAKFLSQVPEMVVSGGMDCTVVMWNFKHGTPISTVSTQSIRSEVQSENMFINPPMVYSLDTWTSLQCVVCGLGNGMVAVYEVTNKEMQLQCSLAAHSAMVVCVHCIERVECDASKYYVVSGSNDCKVIVMEMELQCHSGACSSGYMQLKAVQELQHNSKINWISVDTIGNVAVADQTSFVSFYKIF